MNNAILKSGERVGIVSCADFLSDNNQEEKALNYLRNLGLDLIISEHAVDPDEWQSDETGHWKVCKDCGAEFARAEHDYGEDGACTECGYTQALQPDPPEQPEPTLPENRRAAPTRRG